MKRLIMLVIAGVMTLVLGACDNNGPKPSDTPNAAPEMAVMDGDSDKKDDAKTEEAAAPAEEAPAMPSDAKDDVAAPAAE